MRISICSFLVAMAASAAALSAQTTRPFVESAETHYYDFYVGRWLPLVDGRIDSTGTAFIVRRSVHPAAYEEDWVQRIDSVEHRSTALRAWDQIENRWMFTWISGNALFQVWRGEKVGKDWYIVRDFDFEGQKFVSRQAWIPEGPDRLVRVMERSTDGGRTWQTRYRGVYQRVADRAGDRR